MNRSRIDIPPDLATEVLFLSDRKCCVCKDPNRRVQIHHINEDPSCNELSNLAVLCNDHHSEAHTKNAFARNLTPLLIQRYNDAWRRTVRAQLEPQNSGELQRAYAGEVGIDLSLLLHSWKTAWFSIDPGILKLCDGKGNGIWEALSNAVDYEWSREVWEKFFPLFRSAIGDMRDRIERMFMMHSAVVPTSVRVAGIHAMRRFELEQSAYLLVPNPMIPDQAKKEFFLDRFRQMCRSLREFESAGEVMAS